MPLPIAHSLISAAVFVTYKRGLSIRDDLKGLALFAFAGLLPDIDFITVPFTGFGGHRGVTHSFAFAFVATAILYMVVSYIRQKKESRLWLFLFIAMAIHPLCDFFTYDYLVERGGVMLFYPFSQSYFESPVSIFMGIELRYLETILSLHTLQAVIREALLSGLVLVTAIYLKTGSLKRVFDARPSDMEES